MRVPGSCLTTVTLLYLRGCPAGSVSGSVSIFDTFCKRSLKVVLQCLNSENVFVNFVPRYAVLYSRMCSVVGRNVQFLARDATQSAVMRQYVVCPSVRLSGCLSVTFRYRDHIGWNTSKLISWRIA